MQASRANGNTYLQRRLQWSPQSQLTIYVLGALAHPLWAVGAVREGWSEGQDEEKRRTVMQIFATVIAHIV